MNKFFHDHGVQAGMLFAGFVIAYLGIVWLIGRLRESYVDRYNLLALRIGEATTAFQLIEINNDAEVFYDEFCRVHPFKVAELTANLGKLISAKASALGIHESLIFE